MTFPLAGAAAPIPYRIATSLRFRAANTASISRTPSSTSNRRTFTWSAWIKRGNLSSPNYFFGVGPTSQTNGAFQIVLQSDATLQVSLWDGASVAKRTSAVFRDPTAWYHLVVGVDTTNATAADRVRIYVNGAEILSFSASANPTQNLDTLVNNSGSEMRLGATRDSGGTVVFHFDGHIAEFHMVDGQQLSPSAFGRDDPATGAWSPRRYSGTYGANGFYLPFNDATSTTTIAQDRSGNANHWTGTGISVTSGAAFDQTSDTPTNNFATFNPLAIVSGATSAGSMRFTNTSGSTAYSAIATMPIGIDSIYAEIRLLAAPTGQYPNIGLWHPARALPCAAGQIAGQSSTFNDFGAAANGGYYVASAFTSNGNTTANGDVVMLAFQRSTGRVWMGKNGTWWNAGNPAGLTNAYATIGANIDFYLAVGSAFSAEVELNCGQKPFAHTPPTGFQSLCTTSLADPTIRRADDAFHAGLRTGTGAAASVTGLRFRPGVVVVKSRNGAAPYNAYDEVRGVNRGIEFNTTNFDHNDGNTLTAFDATGFSLGNDANARGVNVNTHAYVDWAWRRGAVFGVDVATWTGNGSNRTVAHGLNAVPQMIWVKALNAGTGWYVYHHLMAASPQNVFHFLNGATSAAPTADATVWNDTAPTSGTFSLGTNSGVNGSGTSFMALLFTAVSGFSAFPRYTGNGSSDGAFVHLGFRPRWFLNKNIGGTAANWFQFDAARDTGNPLVNRLFLNGSGGESGGNALDFVSGGVKFRAGDPNYNGGATDYICAAFAETPFKFATAR